MAKLLGLLSLSVFFSAQLVAQLHIPEFIEIKKEADLEEVIWADDLTYADFDLSLASEYTEDDAVVLEERSYHFLKRVGGIIMRRQLFRYAVLMVTEKGIEDFSTFDLGQESGLDKFANVGIRVFKSDGEVIKMPESSFETGEGWKLAVPDLEVGDILEFYIFSVNKDTFTGYGANYSPITHFLTNKHTTLRQYLEISLDKRMQIKYRLLNGAPEAEKIYPEYGGRVMKLVWDIEEVHSKIDDTWAYNRLRSEPAIRFLFTSSMSGNANYFPSDSQQDLVSRVSGFPVYYSAIEETKTSKKLRKLVRKDLKEDTYPYAGSRDVIVDYYRRLAHKKNVERDDKFGRYNSNPVLYTLARKANHMGVDVEWIYIRPTYFGDDIAEILGTRSLSQALKLSFADEGEDLLFYSDWMGAPLGANFSVMDGAPYYAKKLTDSRNQLSHVGRLPQLGSDDNIEYLTLDLKILEGGDLGGEALYMAEGYINEGMELNCLDYSRGYCQQLRHALPYEENISTLGYPGESRWSEEVLTNPKKDDNVDRLETENDDGMLQAQHGKWLLENGKRKIERMVDAEIEPLEGLTILSTGRLRPGDHFSFSSDFALKEQVQELGKNKLLKLSWLLDTFDESTRKREGPVHMNYVYTDKLDLFIEVPEGYTVQGLEELNKEVGNDFGFFSSAAALDDGKVKISYELRVDKKYLDAEEWDMVLAIFDTAYDFSEGKILFKAD